MSQLNIYTKDISSLKYLFSFEIYSFCKKKLKVNNSEFFPLTALLT